MRLIDADVVEQIITSLIIMNSDIEGESAERARLVCEFASCHASIIVSEIPTAYDIDKVVEELELHSFEFGTDTLPAHYVRLNKAIDIVAGGKNDR